MDFSVACCLTPVASLLLAFLNESLPTFPVDLRFPSVQQPEQAGFAIESFEGKFLADAVTAVDLDCGISGLKGHVRCLSLCEGGGSEKWQFMIGAPCRVQ